MAPKDAGTDTSTQLAQQRTALAGDRTKLGDKRTGMALKRTLLALDRTLMAWVRTGTSLISFGFTIYKFFQYLREDQPVKESGHLLDPRDVALILIALGIGALVLATIQYQRQTRELLEEYPEYGPFPRSIAAGVAGIMSGLGLLGFVLVMLRQ
jgi:putative membrane protein